MRYQFIDAEKANYPITMLCRVLGVSRSGFYAWRSDPPSCGDTAEHLLVRELQRTYRGALGSRQMAVKLAAHGIHAGRYRARTLMREAQAPCRQRRRYKATTDRDPTHKAAPNLLARAFDVDEPDTAWVSDITAIWTLQGWLYLAAVMDLYNREIVGWSLKSTMETALVLDALNMAVDRRSPPRGLLFHSDRGSQYTSEDFRDRLQALGAIQSMSRKGNCWDNAVMERFFGSLKSEWCEVQRYRTREEARRDVVEYIELIYNADRPHTTLGNRTPRAFRAAYAA